MQMVCYLNHQPLDAFIHVIAKDSYTKTLKLSFWVKKSLEPRISQIVNDTARSYGIRCVSRLDDCLVATSPKVLEHRVELNYSFTDSHEKINNILLKVGRHYRKYLTFQRLA